MRIQVWGANVRQDVVRLEGGGKLVRSSDVARLMVQLLLVAPAGSFAEYDADAGEIVVVVSDAALMDSERRLKLHRALDELDAD